MKMAFPQPVPDDSLGHDPGMSLRDYFAAKAMAATIAGFASASRDMPKPDVVAGIAYIAADAMLAERAYSAADAKLSERAK